MLAMKLQQNEWEERHGGCESEGVEKPRADAADSPQPARPRRLISCDCTDMDCTFTAPFRWPVAGLQSLITAQRGDPRRAFDFRERYAPFTFHHSPLLSGRGHLESGQADTGRTPAWHLMLWVTHCWHVLVCVIRSDESVLSA
jgi:hypothetical protein